MAVILANGEITERDYSAAKAWCEKAVNNKYIEAYALLGYLYEFGFGTEININKSKKLYLEGSKLGEPNAKLNLANLYYFGKLGNKDFAKAFKLYREACTARNSKCARYVRQYV